MVRDSALKTGYMKGFAPTQNLDSKKEGMNFWQKKDKRIRGSISRKPVLLLRNADHFFLLGSHDTAHLFHGDDKGLRLANV